MIDEAQQQKKNGVAVITSDGSFMAKKDLFLKNGFELVTEKDGCQLLVKKFDHQAQLPYFTNDEQSLKKYAGWHIIYSPQCPWVARFIEEVKPLIQKEKLTINIKPLTSAQEAQHAPSIYAVFNLIKDGQLLADRYISLTRFLNIIRKNS